jgi:hypothetical protein
MRTKADIGERLRTYELHALAPVFLAASAGSKLLAVSGRPAIHNCPVWVIRVGFAMSARSPLIPQQHTFAE